MFYRTFIFLCFFSYLFVNAEDSKEISDTIALTTITFNINMESNKLSCDHTNIKQLKEYTALEGGQIKIVANYKNYVNHIICSNNSDTDYKSTGKSGKEGKAFGLFQVEKGMGTQWNCTILAHQGNEYLESRVIKEGEKYAASFCFMKIHVRQIEAPQTILVNNMALSAVRTDLSNNYADFTAEYQYADGDVVNVLCANLMKRAPLTMEYAMANQLIDMYNSTYLQHLASDKAVGFVTTLRSGHDNTYMLCTNTEPTDYTISKVTFVMQKYFNIVSVKINGMTMRPKLTHADNNMYEIEYKYVIEQDITVVCEVNHTDMKLVVFDDEFRGKVSGYDKKGISPSGITKKVEMTFRSHHWDKKTLKCSSDYATKGSSVEMVLIHFTPADNLIELHNLHMDMPSNGKVMEVYNHDKFKLIFYEFEEGETMKLICSTRFYGQGVQRLEFIDSFLVGMDSAVKTMNISAKDDNTETACYLKESGDPSDPTIPEKILYQIRLIFHRKDLTTTTTSPTEQPPEISGEHATAEPPADDKGASPERTNDMNGKTVPIMAMIAGVVVCIIIICVSIVIIKVRKRNQSQGGPHVRNYANLQTPSETSIPPYPPQWESNYAVPVDRRTDDTTYSVPCQEPALYSVPTPKNQRPKKQAANPTYAVLDLKNPQRQKNIFKETDNPNYSEVYANRNEQCYAKVLPKSVRDKMEQNPYSNVMTEPSYANTNPEPMYCEPSTVARPQGNQYANINTPYANGQDYVEPTYCEPQKRIK